MSRLQSAMRRQLIRPFMRRRIGFVIFLLMAVLNAYGGSFGDPARPNILLIVAEDMGARVGAFGDPIARTPSLDALANQGIRYPNTFTVSGVCSPSRSSLITGVHAISMGTHQMRTGHGVPNSDVDYYEAVPPPEVKAFPELLRGAGYATANFAKKDYQFGEPFTIWDLDAGDFMSHLEPALWRQLPQDRPFFVMMNLMVTHESGLATMDAEYPPEWRALIQGLIRTRAEQVEAITDPASVSVPPYYPDTPAVRASIAQFYDNVYEMDRQVGSILAALDEDGLTENTIVIWTTDHGDGFPRAKRSVYDSGIKVPMILRLPEGNDGGSVNEDLVSFIDLAPTILELTGAMVPTFIQGQSFLDDTKRQFVFAARDRTDENLDRVRAARDQRYKYIQNLMPELPYFRPLTFRDMFPIMRDWWSGHANGTLNSVQNFYFRAPRPAEELYDTVNDPWEIKNLADDQHHADALVRLRGALDGWITRVGDLGDAPEIEMVAKMWPNLEQPLTAAPEARVLADTSDSRRIALSNSTEGASIGYRIDGGSWLLYTAPITLEIGQSIEAKAIRYGYKESAVTTVK